MTDDEDTDDKDGAVIRDGVSERAVRPPGFPAAAVGEREHSGREVRA